MRIRSTLKEVFPRDLTCRYLRNRPTCYNMVHGSPVAKLPCFAPPQSFLKRFGLRWWQLKCRFAASSAPKLQNFAPTHSSCTIAFKHCCTWINLILSSSNCPVLNPCLLQESWISGRPRPGGPGRVRERQLKGQRGILTISPDSTNGSLTARSATFGSSWV